MKKHLINLITYLLLICLICTGCINLKDNNYYKISKADNAPVTYITDPDGKVFVRDAYTAIIGWKSSGIFEINGEDAAIGFCPKSDYRYVYKTENEDCLCLRNPYGLTECFFSEGFKLPDFDDKTIDLVEINYFGTEKIELKNKYIKRKLIEFISSNIFTDDESETEELLDYYGTLWFSDSDSKLFTAFSIYYNAKGSNYYISFNTISISDADKDITIYEGTRRFECTSILKTCDLI